MREYAQGMAVSTASAATMAAIGQLLELPAKQRIDHPERIVWRTAAVRDSTGMSSVIVAILSVNLTCGKLLWPGAHQPDARTQPNAVIMLMTG